MIASGHPGPLVLGLGSNLGDRRAHLQAARRQLEELLGPLTIAPIYCTAAISPVPQADYWNTVATAPLPDDLAPRQLLSRLKEMEQRAGRVFGEERDLPRPLDIDILLWGQHHLSEAGLDGPVTAEAHWPGSLEIPHPRLRDRRFVLAPLCDLQPSLPLPPDGVTAAAALAALGTAQRVDRLGEL